MSMQVVFLSAAEQDLQELKGYIVKNFGKDSWQASYSTIKETINTLKTFPLGGKIPEEIESLHLTQFRQVLSGMNRIIYEVRQETLYIHIVCDVRKDMKSHLTRRLLRAS
ncbi:MAG: type II toxin-antitoxin system RelE/ParE family toxin [Burkholderiaceae bacterium]